MLDLWLKILDIMDRLMNSGQGDNLEEAVPESLKNILLVMADGGFLNPPSPGSMPSELWQETCKRVDRFLPHLVAELFPQANASLADAGPRPPEKQTLLSPTTGGPEKSAENTAPKPSEESKRPQHGDLDTHRRNDVD